MAVKCPVIYCPDPTITNSHLFAVAASMVDTVTLVQHIYCHLLFGSSRRRRSKGHISYSAQACHTAFT